MAHYHPETPVKRHLTDYLRKRLSRGVVVRIENQTSNALPDIMITYNKVTSWIEVKYAKPDFRSKGDQELMMLRLAREGFANYVIFYEFEGDRLTYILDPKDIGRPRESWHKVAPGFAYGWVCDFVEDLHRGNHPVR